MQRILTANPLPLPTKPLLTNRHTPALIADVDEDVATAIEGTEGDAWTGRGATGGAGGGGGDAEAGEFEDALDDEDGFFEAFAGNADVWIRRDDAHCTVFPHNHSREIHGAHTVSKCALSNVE